ncbi:hypothetical protein [Prosthecobacter sp.]|uniref:hypothetical protein n=1 Tax=Prosthecobacter sp. TaxID=1965333 RepID=UPI003784E550
MRIFQRFEVWLLLLVGGIAIWWAFSTGPNPGETGPETRPDSPLQLRRCTVERDFGNARLDLEVRYKNTSPRPLSMQAPDVRLINAAGKEVPPFILPIERPPTAEAQTTGDIRLRFWLEKADLAGALTLEVRGEKLEVKDSTPLDLEKLENAKPKVWTSAAWKP